MRVSKYFVIVAAAMMVAGTAFTGAPYVFVSNTDAGQIVKVYSDGSTEILFEQNRFGVEDLVVGPDDLLYACAPEEQTVFRFDPEDVIIGSPFGLGDTEIVYDGSTQGPESPQCGWFSDQGDLFTTDSDEAVWVFYGLVPNGGIPAGLPATASVLVSSSDTGAFQGQGVTQAAAGDLLFANAKKNNGALWTLGFDPIFRFEAPGNAPQILIDDLDYPLGVARSGNGTIFVATDNGLEAYQDGSLFCSVSSNAFGKQDPQFLAFTADDTLYVATDSKKAATLWEVDTDCNIVGEVVTFAKPDWKPSMSGVAVPRTDRTAGASTNPNSPADYFFGFKDHAYEVTSVPVAGECSITSSTITAAEEQPECLANLINCYLNTDENDELDGVTGVAVTYAGDGGVGQLYTVEGSCNPGVDAIEHAISAFTPLVRNPRVVKCSIPPEFDICAPCTAASTPKFCDLIELDSFFPFNGIFPDDGRIGSRSSASFSEYFFADITLAEDGGSDNTPGCFCGWESPMPDIDYIPADPFGTLPNFNSGSNVPLKFRVAALGPGETCETSNPCVSAPHGYVTGAEVLLSIARVRNADNLDVFEPIRPVSGNASVPGIIFGNPNSPSTPFHFNLDTSGYETGVYQAVAVALTDNFEVEWTYFVVD